MKFGMWTTILKKKTTYNEFEIGTAIFWLTTTTQTTAQATGGGGVRGSRGRESKGPLHHQQDFTIFFLRQEPPYLGMYHFFLKCIAHSLQLSILIHIHAQDLWGQY